MYLAMSEASDQVDLPSHFWASMYRMMIVVDLDNKPLKDPRGRAVSRVSSFSAVVFLVSWCK